MKEKQVIYNGVLMHPDWPAKIEEAQLVIGHDDIVGLLQDRSMAFSGN